MSIFTLTDMIENPLYDSVMEDINDLHDELGSPGEFDVEETRTNTTTGNADALDWDPHSIGDWDGDEEAVCEWAQKQLNVVYNGLGLFGNGGIGHYYTTAEWDTFVERALEIINDERNTVFEKMFDEWAKYCGTADPELCSGGANRRDEDKVRIKLWVEVASEIDHDPTTEVWTDDASFFAIEEAEILDLNPAGDEDEYNKAQVEVLVTVRIDSERYQLEYQTGSTSDVGAISDDLQAYVGTDEYDMFAKHISAIAGEDNIAIAEAVIGKAAGVRKIWHDYITENYCEIDEPRPGFMDAGSETGRIVPIDDDPDDGPRM